MSERDFNVKEAKEQQVTRTDDSSANRAFDEVYSSLYKPARSSAKQELSESSALKNGVTGKGLDRYGVKEREGDYGRGSKEREYPGGVTVSRHADGTFADVTVPGGRTLSGAEKARRNLPKDDDVIVGKDGKVVAQVTPRGEVTINTPQGQYKEGKTGDVHPPKGQAAQTNGSEWQWSSAPQDFSPSNKSRADGRMISVNTDDPLGTAGDAPRGSLENLDRYQSKAKQDITDSEAELKRHKIQWSQTLDDNGVTQTRVEYANGIKITQGEPVTKVGADGKTVTRSSGSVEFPSGSVQRRDGTVVDRDGNPLYKANGDGRATIYGKDGNYTQTKDGQVTFEPKARK